MTIKFYQKNWPNSKSNSFVCQPTHLLVHQPKSMRFETIQFVAPTQATSVIAIRSIALTHPPFSRNNLHCRFKHNILPRRNPLFFVIKRPAYTGAGTLPVIDRSRITRRIGCWSNSFPNYHSFGSLEQSFFQNSWMKRLSHQGTMRIYNSTAVSAPESTHQFRQNLFQIILVSTCQNLALIKILGFLYRLLDAACLSFCFDVLSMIMTFW